MLQNEREILNHKKRQQMEAGELSRLKNSIAKQKIRQQLQDQKDIKSKHLEKTQQLHQQA